MGDFSFHFPIDEFPHCPGGFTSSSGDIPVARGAHGSFGCAGTTAPGVRDGVDDAGTRKGREDGNCRGLTYPILFHFWIGLMVNVSKRTILWICNQCNRCRMVYIRYLVEENRP